MINKKEVMKTADMFRKDKSCYIHTEMMDGKVPETVLCGDVTAMLWCIVAQINRIAQLTRTSFEETHKAVFSMYMLNDYSKVNSAMSGGNVEEIEGHDYEEEILQEIEERIKAECDKKVKELYLENLQLEHKIEFLESQVSGIRKSRDDERKHFSKEKQGYEKEILKMEHRMKDMENALMGFGGKK